MKLIKIIFQLNQLHNFLTKNISYWYYIFEFCAFNVIPEWYRDRIQKKYSITVEEWEEREGVKLEDGLYRDLMRRGAGDELAAGCAKSQMFHDASQATI